MKQYDPKKIEKKWQKRWEKEKAFQTPKNATSKDKYYILPQLPYPSGSGLHVGHAEVYTACDIYARYKRMTGKKVLQVIGWDAFGLPAENYAIKTNVHPRVSTDKAIDNFREQIKALGVSVDWDREVGSHNSDYYKWTQWFFLLFYKRGLAYRKKQSVNWCDSCKTVLANEQVASDGKCERCETVVEQREMEQWYLKITDYADRLLADLDKVDWPDETKKRQRDWIGRSEGAEIDFKIKNSNEKIRVFTTRPDTLFGATFMVLAPEHTLVGQLKDGIKNWKEVEKYINETKLKTDLDRQTQKEKIGVELKGVKAVNPANNEEIPVFIADYVLATYGFGAIMAVPAHDERDFEFAQKYGLPIKQVVARLFTETDGPDKPRHDKKTVRRKTAFSFLKHWKEDKYLCLDWTKYGWHSGIIGGIDDGEDEIEAARREIHEETGYRNIRFVKKIHGEIHNNFFAAHKDENRYAYGECMLFELENDAQDPTEAEHTKNHDAVWVEKSKMRDFLNLMNFRYAWEILEGRENSCFADEGVAIYSDFLNDLKTKEASEKMIDWLEKQGIGKRKVQYKLRDWSVSRQRFWGAPIPVLYDEKNELHPVPEEDLPVILPDDVDFKPTGESPLNYSKNFNKGVEKKYGKGWRREPDTLDTFMCSSWYYYRYLDPHNDKAFASPEALKTWMPVDFYLGGPEHVNGHLLYSRFFTKVLFDAGYINFDEPFLVHRHQGMILGEDNHKMSKRWGNAINPTDVVHEFGADTLRAYEMFMGPLEADKPWDTNGVKGIRRFLERVWHVQEKMNDKCVMSEKMTRLMHQTVKKVTHDVENLRFNTAIAKMMELVNEMYKEEKITADYFSLLVLILSPFAPHMCEEIWETFGHKTGLSEVKWPEYSEEMARETEITLAVQINGKLRDTLLVPAEISEAEVKVMALKSEKVQKWLEGKEPKKIIYIKGKLLSIVV
jgi:leucyl-tRNA synthetase